MDIRKSMTLLTGIVSQPAKPGQRMAISGFIAVHISAVGLATATLPIASALLALAGMTIYMIGAHQRLKYAETAVEKASMQA